MVCRERREPHCPGDRPLAPPPAGLERSADPGDRDAGTPVSLSRHARATQPDRYRPRHVADQLRRPGGAGPRPGRPNVAAVRRGRGPAPGRGRAARYRCARARSAASAPPPAGTQARSDPRPGWRAAEASTRSAEASTRSVEASTRSPAGSSRPSPLGGASPRRSCRARRADRPGRADGPRRHARARAGAAHAEAERLALSLAGQQRTRRRAEQRAHAERELRLDLARRLEQRRGRPVVPARRSETSRPPRRACGSSSSS